MSGTSVGKTPSNDAEWAREQQRRVEAVENPESTRVGAWVLSTSASGALLASHVDGGSVVLANPPETVDDPDAVDSGLPLLKVSTSTPKNGQVTFDTVDTEIGSWGFTSGSNQVIIPLSGTYLVVAVPVYVLKSGSYNRFTNVLIDGVRVLSANSASGGDGAGVERPNMTMASTFDLNAGQSVALEAEPPDSTGTPYQVGTSNDNPGVVTSLSVICLARS